MLLARLAHKVVRPLSREMVSTGSTGLMAFMGGGEDIVLETYRLIFRGILAQDLETGNLKLLAPGSRFRVAALEPRCRWHDGPLDRRDDPLARTYCLARVSENSLGYCRAHRGSLRALYEECFGGNRGLEACRKLDEELGDSISYTIYLTVHSGVRVKVGVTRSFRLLDRLAEQPHDAATILLETTSAMEARMAERRISRLPGFSDRGPRRPGQAEMPNLALLLDASRRAASLLGVGWEPRALRIQAPGTLGSARSVGALGSGVYTLRNYWGGFLLLEDSSGLVAVRSSRLTHRALLLEDRGV